MTASRAEGYRIIDADGHVMELDEELAEHIGPPYDGLEWHRSYGFWPGLTADGYLRSLRKPGGWAGGGSGPSAQDWLRFLDINCIERTILYPTQGLTHGFIRDPEWAVALARAYNDWVHARFMRVSPRLVAVARFPRLRYGCLECGIGWVPYFMDRMDEEHSRKGQYSPQCRRKPSDYVRSGNIFFAAEVGEDRLTAGSGVRTAGRDPMGVRLSS